MDPNSAQPSTELHTDVPALAPSIPKEISHLILSTHSPPPNTSIVQNASIESNIWYQRAFYIGIWYPAIFCSIGIPLNVANIFVVCQKWNVSPHFAYVTILSFVDCLLLFHRAANMYLPLTPIPVTSPVCAWIQFMIQTSSQMSSWILVLLCFERAMVVKFPFFRLTFFSSRRALFSMAVVALVTVALNMIVLFAVSANHRTGYCEYRDEYVDLVSTVFYKLEAFSYAFIPLALLIVFNAIIVTSLRKSESVRHDRASTGSSKHESVCPKQSIISVTKRPSVSRVKCLCLRSNHRKFNIYKKCLVPCYFPNSPEIQENKEQVVNGNESLLKSETEMNKRNKQISFQTKSSSSSLIFDMTRQRENPMNNTPKPSHHPVYLSCLAPTRKCLSDPQLNLVPLNANSSERCNENRVAISALKLREFKLCTSSRVMSDFTQPLMTSPTAFYTSKHTAQTSGENRIVTSIAAVPTLLLPTTTPTHVNKTTADFDTSSLSPPTRRRNSCSSRGGAVRGKDFYQIIISIIAASVVFFLTTIPYCLIAVFMNFLRPDGILSQPSFNFWTTLSVALCDVNHVANFFLYSLKTRSVFTRVKSFSLKISKHYLCGRCKVRRTNSLWSLFRKSILILSDTVSVTRCSGSGTTGVLGGGSDGHNTNDVTFV